ncbi:hypothetical protein ACJMK2_034010 [Sinanodonta woodiana]|uniref:Uncharacterized protein n=1 Tax=Sinanodonta woodiana TaxID=1069815 RepID=A0ABD3WSE4_SINWO
MLSKSAQTENITRQQDAEVKTELAYEIEISQSSETESSSEQQEEEANEHVDHYTQLIIIETLNSSKKAENYVSAANYTAWRHLNSKKSTPEKNVNLPYVSELISTTMLVTKRRFINLSTPQLN